MHPHTSHNAEHFLAYPRGTMFKHAACRVSQMVRTKARRDLRDLIRRVGILARAPFFAARTAEITNPWRARAAAATTEYLQTRVTLSSLGGPAISSQKLGRGSTPALIFPYVD